MPRSLCEAEMLPELLTKLQQGQDVRAKDILWIALFKTCGTEVAVTTRAGAVGVCDVGSRLILKRFCTVAGWWKRLMRPASRCVASLGPAASLRRSVSVVLAPRRHSAEVSRCSP